MLWNMLEAKDMAVKNEDKENGTKRWKNGTLMGLPC